MKVLNDILGYKNLKLYQDQDYFCFSLDSIVLANYCNIRLRDSKIVEFCSGNGVVSIILSQRTKTNIVGVEIQEKLFDMSNESLKINNLEDRITFVNDDIKNFVKDKNNYVDMIVCNPPYFKYDEKNKINESIEKRIARHEVCINIDEICDCASQILKDNGKLCIVHRTDRFNDVYEFTFKVAKEYTNTTNDILFGNGEIINLKYSDKEGLDRISQFYCDKD